MSDVESIELVAAWRAASHEAIQAELAYFDAVLKARSEEDAQRLEGYLTRAQQLRARATALYRPAMQAVTLASERAAKRLQDLDVRADKPRGEITSTRDHRSAE